MTFESIKGGTEMDESTMTTKERAELKETLLSFVIRVGGDEPGRCRPEELAILPDIVRILVSSF